MGEALARAVAAGQGVYYLVTGIWPLVHMGSFQRVTGPKVDGWLVQTAGVLITAIGATLLAIAYGVGIVNRFREGGWRLAAYAPSGLAGAGTFLGLGLVSAGVYGKYLAVTVVGLCLVVVCAGLVATGFFAEAGGGGVGVAQAGIELLDLLLRIGSNVVSFARLAAFGLTHAALCQVVWQGTTGAARHGALGVIAAVLVFAVGNALAFALEALIAGIQALRLEYYELFSRIFLTEGEPFRPWALPIVRADVVKSSVEA